VSPLGPAQYDSNLQASPGGIAVARDQARTVLGQVMFLVAITLGFAAAGAYLGRDLGRVGSWVCFGIGFVLIMALGQMRKQSPIAMTLLFALGLFLGLSMGSALNYYTSIQGGHTAVMQAAGGTALLVGGLGAAGWATRRDLSGWGRTLMWTTVALFIAGIGLIFIGGSTAHLVWSIVGLIVFSAWTLYDFNRLRQAHPDQAVQIAVGIFLDIFNIFWFLLDIIGFSRS
jgi:FtsH-binding integral membrane protein